jgi:hypothetical protein
MKTTTIAVALAGAAVLAGCGTSVPKYSVPEGRAGTRLYVDYRNLGEQEGELRVITRPMATGDCRLDPANSALLAKFTRSDPKRDLVIASGEPVTLNIAAGPACRLRATFQPAVGSGYVLDVDTARCSVTLYRGGGLGRSMALLDQAPGCT